MKNLHIPLFCISIIIRRNYNHLALMLSCNLCISVFCFFYSQQMIRCCISCHTVAIPLAFFQFPLDFGKTYIAKIGSVILPEFRTPCNIF